MTEVVPGRGGVYIAGPMRGYPGYNFDRFAEAQVVAERFFPGVMRERWGSAFLTVEFFNPAWHDIDRYELEDLASSEGWGAAGQWLLDNPAEFSLRQALGEDTAWIAANATDLLLLPGWEKSLGARAEKALSEALSLSVWYLHPSEGVIGPVDPQRVLPSDVSATAPSRPECARLGWAQDQAPWVETIEGLNERMGLPRRTELSGGPTLTDLGLGEVRTKSSTGGEKGVKLARYDLIPVGPLRLLAEHYGRGAAKYADNQWRQGYEWSKSIAACMRHFEDWREGKDYDVCPADGYGCQHVDTHGAPFEGIPSEHGPTCFMHTGSHHLVAFLWHGMFLLEGTEHWPEHDDRFIYERTVA